MNEHILLEFKKILKAGRLKAGYSYKELSEKSGISDRNLSKYENDIKADIPIQQIFHLLNILQVPKATLIQLIQLSY
jgi:transcriptional regulator with XRE-family HTH domain